MFGFEARVPRIWYICKGRSNEEDKYMKFRSKELAFFWPLIMPFYSLHMYHMRLEKQHDNQFKTPASKCKGYFMARPNSLIVNFKRCKSVFIVLEMVPPRHGHQRSGSFQVCRIQASSELLFL